nr:hypothetical protein CFP56_14554 [Quercus suber]
MTRRLHAHGSTGNDGIATLFSAIILVAFAMILVSFVVAALVWRNYGESTSDKLCNDLGLKIEESSFCHEAEKKQRCELCQNSDLGFYREVEKQRILRRAAAKFCHEERSLRRATMKFRHEAAVSAVIPS